MTAKELTKKHGTKNMNGQGLNSVCLNQGYRNRYDIIDHGHEKKTFMYFFQRSTFTEIREFATIVLWKLVINFRYRGRTILV